MEQKIFIYRALIYNRRLNSYRVAKTLRDKYFDNRNELLIDFNNWSNNLLKDLDKNDEIIINEQIIE